MKFLIDYLCIISNMTSIYFKILLYSFAAFIYAYFAGLSLLDDGLRHLAFAKNQDIMLSWGDVFPHSLFLTTYDPWFIWHKILALYLQIFPFESVHIVINTTVLFSLMLLLDALIIKYANIKRTPLTIFIVLTIVLLVSARYISLRPDLLSGLYLLLILLLNKNAMTIFFVTLLYSGSYYLFFLYSGSLALSYLILKEYRTFNALLLGTLFGFIFHLYYGGSDFVRTVSYLLSDQSLREGLGVKEGLPLFGFLTIFNYYALVVTIWSLAALIIYKKYNYFKKQPLALLLLIMSPLWLAQVRYLELLLPLFVLFAFLESNTLLHTFFSRKILYFIYKFIKILKDVAYRKLFFFPALIYIVLMFGYLMKKYDHQEILLQKSYYKDQMFSNKTLLLNTLSNDLYYALYLNPTIKFIPSCSIGWFEDNREMKGLYIKMLSTHNTLSEEELNELMEYTGASYYLHSPSNAKEIFSIVKLEKYHIKPLLIIDNKIIFEKER